MPTGSSIGANTATYVVGDAGTGDYDASLVLDADAISVDGVAAANSVATADVALLDSTVTVGSNANIDVDQVGTLTADATTTNGDVADGAITASNATARVLTDTGNTLSVGDAIRFSISTSNGTLQPNTTYFVVNKSGDNFQISTTPGGPVLDITGVSTPGYNQLESSAAAVFSGETGGVIDSSGTTAQVVTITPTAANSTVYALTIDGVEVSFTSDPTATANEITSGLAAAITAAGITSVTPTAGATLVLTSTNPSDPPAIMSSGAGVLAAVFTTPFANNTAGDTTNLDIQAGNGGTIDVDAVNVADAEADNVDGDSLATANVVETYGLQDVGVSVGSNATITVDVDVDALADAATIGVTGNTANAIADADATNVVAVNDLGSGAGEFVIGANGTITANAGTMADRIQISATADTETGDALATANSTLISGINDTTGTNNEVSNVLAVGDGGTITGRGYADINATATSTTGNATATGVTTAVDAIQADTVTVGNDATVRAYADTDSDVLASTVDGDALATNTLTTSQGLDLDNLTIGDVATNGTGFGVIGSAIASLDTDATVTGGQSTDDADADAEIGTVIGAQFGDGVDTDDETALSIGSNGSLAASATVTSDADASAIAGGAEALNLITLQATGLELNEAGTVGANGTISATATVDLDASASNVSTVASGSADNAEAAAGAEYVAGLNVDTADAALTVGNTGSLTAAATVTADAVADSIEGNAEAQAGSFVGTNFDLDAAGATFDVYGAEFDAALTMGAGGTVNADVAVTLLADAETVTNAATATASVNESIALDGSAVSIGSTGNIDADSVVAATAIAESTDSDATATANSTTNAGVDSNGAITIGAGGTLTADADLTLAATAITIGDSVTNDLADANATSGNNTALVLDAANTTIGATGTVIGDADLDASASASAVEGDTDADVDLGVATAIDLSGQTLSIGDGGTLTANSRVGTTASASTTDGDADADIAVDLIAGLGDGSGTATIGSTGVVDADAVGVNIATAASIDADSAAVNATINNDRVTAIDLQSLTTGSNGAIDADASSTQTASASNVGDPGVGDGSASAEVATQDLVFGIDSTLVTVGGDASQLTASATLSGNANATTMSGSSTATAGDRSGVEALTGVSNVVVGDSATAGMAFQAVSNLTANATSIEDDALAQVGTVTAYGTGTGITALTGADVTGVDNSNITVGEDAGTILASASSTLNATAATNGTDGGDIDATAVVATTADGLLASAVSVGDDGNLTAAATLNGTATATNIGDVADTDDDAFAQIQLNADGLQQTSAETITIGASGNVIGQALVDGGASATTVSGSAEAKADLDAFGLNLDNNGADITIGEAGNISGLAVVGELAGGVLSDQIDILATANLEDATAITNLQAAGISGVDGGTLLTAGPSDGDVTGQALAGANLVARTIGDPASTTATTDNAIATLQSSTISGIENVDILGGMVGSNLVRGTSFGDFDVLAESVKGAATGSSTATSYGVFDADGDGNITLSGNMQAIAQLSNTVTARTIEGNATATATGDAIGLGGYSVTIIGSGSMTASASNTSRSLAESVGGRAGA